MATNNGMERKLVALTNSLWDAIDSVRGDLSRGAFIEKALWRAAAVKSSGQKRQPRPTVGTYDREAAKLKRQQKRKDA